MKRRDFLMSAVGAAVVTQVPIEFKATPPLTAAPHSERVPPPAPRIVSERDSRIRFLKAYDISRDEYIWRADTIVHVPGRSGCGVAQLHCAEIAPPNPKPADVDAFKARAEQSFRDYFGPAGALATMLAPPIPGGCEPL